MTRVLVIDDDEPLLRMVRLTLSVEGFEVVTASDGLSGLEAVDIAQPDVVILDLQMPGVDGRQVFRTLRERGKDVPVLILSAFGAHDARRELGATDAMDKPFDPEALALKVRTLASRAERSSAQE